MTAWEYCCVRTSPAAGVTLQVFGRDASPKPGLADMAREVAALGKDGWELVSVVRGGNSQEEWYFKRPVRADR